MTQRAELLWRVGSLMVLAIVGTISFIRQDWGLLGVCALFGVWAVWQIDWAERHPYLHSAACSVCAKGGPMARRFHRSRTEEPNRVRGV